MGKISGISLNHYYQQRIGVGRDGGCDIIGMEEGTIANAQNQVCKLFKYYVSTASGIVQPDTISD